MRGQLIHAQGQVERQGAKMKTGRQRILVRVAREEGCGPPPSREGGEAAPRHMERDR